MRPTITIAFTLFALTCSAAIITGTFNGEFARDGIHTWFINSDSLYIPLLSKDLLNNGITSLGDWLLTPNPYYLPDMLIGAISTAASGDHLLTSIAVYAWIQIALLGGLLTWIHQCLYPSRSQQFRDSISAFAFKSSLTTLGLAITVALIIKADNTWGELAEPFDNALEIINTVALNALNSGHHFSVILAILACVALTLETRDNTLLQQGLPQWRCIIWSLLAAATLSLFVASDIFVALWFSGPYLLSELLRPNQQFKAIKNRLSHIVNKAAFTTTFTGTTAGYLLFKTTNPGYTAAYKPDITIANITNSLANQLQFFAQHSLYYFVLVPAVSAVVFTHIIYRQKQQPKTSIHLPSFFISQLAIGFALPILTAQFPIPNDPGSFGGIFRYTMIIAMVPFIAFGIGLTSLTQLSLENAFSRGITNNRKTYLSTILLVTTAAGLIVSTSSLIAQASELQSKQESLADTLFKQDPGINRIQANDSCVFAEYWNAKRWRGLAGLDTRQVFSLKTLEGYGWITNRSWIGDATDACAYTIENDRIHRNNILPVQP